MSDYEAFLQAKSQLGGNHGFDPAFMPDFLYDFQQSLVEWAVRKGRAAIYADCGLGKTPMELVWAENVVRHTNGRVLILTPCAVGVRSIFAISFSPNQQQNGVLRDGTRAEFLPRIVRFDNRQA